MTEGPIKEKPDSAVPQGTVPGKELETANSNTWWVAIILAVITVTGSLGSSYLVTKKTASEKVDEVLGANIVPIGTIVGSVLPPQEFYRQAKIEPAVFDPEKYTWVLADGRDVTRSAFEKFTPDRRHTVPDLRGRFLRGINESRSDWQANGDPDGARNPGTDQADGLSSHTHSGTVSTNTVDSGLALGWGGTSGTHAKWLPGTVANVSITATGGPETRPRNTAVFWYIRIN